MAAEVVCASAVQGRGLCGEREGEARFGMVVLRVDNRKDNKALG